MMKHRNRILLAVIGVSVIFAPTIATAQSTPTRPPTNIKANCRNPQTQFEMNFCAAESAKASDRALNQAYQKAIARVKGTPNESQLVDAQLAWIKFRDADCAFARDRFKGGSIAPMVYSGCITQLSQERAKRLEAYATEGSL
ncbi:MAG TPA: lysozyme inhibitor LprI family protein [Leptolyngbya sp.]|jgi:uncharacterized protein YecT (DUF1311 family)|nr:lysozyme inhibitor LprI family protein [Leptolyngbya sp.]